MKRTLVESIRDYFNKPTRAARRGHAKRLSRAILCGESLEDRRMLANYNLVAELVNPDPDLNDHFSGHALSGFGGDPTLVAGSLAIDRGTVVVGAAYDDTRASNAGAVYVYEDAVSQPLILLNPDANKNQTGGQQRPWTADNDLFGNDVDIVERTLFIGARDDDLEVSNPSNAFTDTGSVRTYNLDTQAWSRIDHPDPWSFGQFGMSVAATDEVLIVTADSHDGDLDNDGFLDAIGAYNDAGIVYALNPGTGAVLQKFNNPNPDFQDGFGWGLDVHGDWVVIGVPLNNLGDEGEAYLWNWKTGAYSTISNPDPETDDFFGADVAIHGNRFVVTAPGQDIGNDDDVGRAYLYSFNPTTGVASSPKVIANPATVFPEQDHFGSSVDMTDSTIVIGASKFLDFVSEPDIVSAYTFTNDPASFAASGNLDQTLTLEPGNYGISLGFGASVAIDKEVDVLAIGAPDASTGQSKSGAAFIYAETPAPIKFTVDTTDDLPDTNPGDGVATTANGTVSLRAAIQEANGQWGRPQVTICLPQGHFELTRTGSEQDIAGHNDLDVLGDITIEGEGAGLSVIDAEALGGGDADDRVFEVLAGGLLALSGVTLTGGDVGSAAGGAIFVNGGGLTLSRSAVVDNQAHNGGGIRVFGDSAGVLIEDSLFTENAASGEGGAVYIETNSGASPVRIGSSVFAANTAVNGFNNVHKESTTINLGNNVVDADDGLFSVGSNDHVGSAPTHVVTSVADVLDASDDSHALSLGILTLREAVRHLNSSAGSIWLPAWQYALTSTGGEGSDAEFNDLDVTGDITIVGVGAGLSVIDAESLGGGDDDDRVFEVRPGGQLIMSRVTLTGGDVGSSTGGAIFVNNGDLALSRSAVVDNQAFAGGGIRVFGTSADVVIVDSLFSENAASTGGAVYIETNGGTSAVQIGSSVFVGNTATSGPDAVRDETTTINLGNNLTDAADGFFSAGLNDLIDASSTVTAVTTVADRVDSQDGQTSLRETVIDGSATVWAPAWNFRLTESDAAADSESVNDLDVTSTQTIVGVGPGLTIIDASGLSGDGVQANDRVFQVSGATTDLDLSRLTVTGGDVGSQPGGGTGGGIFVSDAGLTLTKVAVVGNESRSGGGLRVMGSADVAIDRTVFAHNNAFSGGAIYSGDQNSDVSIGNSVFAKNTADNGLNALRKENNTTNLGGNLSDDEDGFFTAVNDHVGAVDRVVTGIGDTLRSSPGLNTLSVREAVTLANGTTATEEVWMPAWTFVLTIDGNALDAGAIKVTESIKLRGTPAGLTEVDATVIKDYAFLLLGDADDDGDVDGDDIIAVQNNFGNTNTTNGAADWDYDVDGDDLVAIQTNFGHELQLHGDIELHEVSPI